MNAIGLISYGFDKDFLFYIYPVFLHKKSKACNRLTKRVKKLEKEAKFDSHLNYTNFLHQENQILMKVKHIPVNSIKHRETRLKGVFAKTKRGIC